VQRTKAEQASLTSLTALPTHIARIKKTGTDHIICGALSSDGSRAAFCDQAGLHVYDLPAESAITDDVESVSEQTGPAPVSDVKSQKVAEGEAGRKLMRLAVPEESPTFHELQFRPSSPQLLGLTAQGSLMVLDVPTAAVCSVAAGTATYQMSVCCENSVVSVGSSDHLVRHACDQQPLCECRPLITGYSFAPHQVLCRHTTLRPPHLFTYQERAPLPDLCIHLQMVTELSLTCESVCRW